MALLPGTRLGPYEILAPLGAGGMGEVYRARDGKLGRDVAVKILPPEVAGDPERRKRFEQEARAASSLNHPSIVPVYDVGIANSVHYIAMELVAGRSLRELVSSGPLPVKKLLDLAIETADGLAKAHAAGIVHRDLKPENLIVTPEGHVKVLDFGLAKLAEGSARDIREEPTLAKVETRAGQIMGTAGYMSPEQASGQAVDFRSDQFSFGAMLYEMASGRRAFQGKSAADTLAIILRDQPEPLTRVNPAVPEVLRWIVEERCLAKDPGERYASTWDLLRDLRSVRDHLSEVMAGLALKTSARPTWRRRVTLATLALGWPLFLLAVLQPRRTPAPIPPTFRQITFQRGTIWSARFAPDGQTIVYGAAWEGHPVEPFLTRLGGPESRPLGFPGAEILAISSGGENAISLDRQFIGGWSFAGTLARVALAGGAPRPVLEDVEWADWSPDGSTLAVVRKVRGKTQLEYPIGKVLYATAGWISHARVSGKGDRVAFLDHPLLGDDRGSVAVVDRSGNQRTLAGEFESVQGLAWSASGDQVYYTATVETGNARALHAVTLAGIERRVATVAGSLTLHEVSKDGRILFGRETARVAIVGAATGGVKERDLSALDWSLAMDLSPDGRSLLISEQGQGAGSNYAVYLRRMDTDAPPVLLGEGVAAALSPDGKWVLAVLPSQRRKLILLPTGAGEVKRLPETELTYQTSGATFLPDGRRIVCVASEAGHGVRLYVQGLEGGKPRPISPEGVHISLGAHPLSPDGRLVAAIGLDRTLRLYPVDGGEARAIPGIEPGELPIRFSSDGRALYVYRQPELPARIFRLELATGRRSLWKVISPSDPAGITNGIARIQLSADGQSYAYNVSRFLSELYVAEGIQ
jgi:Tol biopolymer transport system component